MPVILATWKAEIGRIKVGGQPGHIVGNTLPPLRVKKKKKTKKN
jgi:hypothetical protein